MNWTNFFLCVLWPCFILSIIHLVVFIVGEAKENKRGQASDSAKAGLICIFFFLTLTVLSGAALVGIYTANNG